MLIESQKHSRFDTITTEPKLVSEMAHPVFGSSYTLPELNETWILQVNRRI